MTDSACRDLYDFDRLPQDLPVFPLSRVILMPGISLPLNIFEPRYLAMVDRAMQGDRLIGMVQPRPDGGGLYHTGGAGRITAYEETDDGRYLIALKGICRFDILEELPQDAGGFRLVRAGWQAYRADVAATAANDVCRDGLLDMLRPYLAKMDMNCEQWDHMRQVPCDRLVSTLAMICPFGVEEKQMLLEAATLEDRMKILRVFLESALMDTPAGGRDDQPLSPHRCH